MPWDKAICSNCGGTLNVNQSKGTAVCPFCDTQFTFNKSTNSYVINIGGVGDVIEQMIKRAEALIQIGEDRKAYAQYKEITDKYPGDYRGWLGLLKFEWNESAYNNVLIFSPDDKKSRVSETCKRINNINNSIKDTKLEINRMKENIDLSNNRIKYCVNADKEYIDKCPQPLFYFGPAIFFVLLGIFCRYLSNGFSKSGHNIGSLIPQFIFFILYLLLFLTAAIGLIMGIVELIKLIKFKKTHIGDHTEEKKKHELILADERAKLDILNQKMSDLKNEQQKELSIFINVLNS